MTADYLDQPAPPLERSAVLVRNPGARRAVAPAVLREAIAPLERDGWRIDVRDTAERGDATRLARGAAEAGTAVVIACGGDGTVNEVVNGLAGTETALAAAPAGTANVWAREAFIPRDPTAALALLRNGRCERVDLGLMELGGGPVQPRHFLLMCSLGLDATAVREVERRPGAKRWLAQGAFAWPAVTAFARARAVDATVTIDGVEERRSLLLGIAGNTRLYGGVLRLTSAALMNDGLLDLVTFEDSARTNRWRHTRYARLLFRAMRGRLDATASTGVAYRRGAHIEITPGTPMGVQADGEYVGECGPDVSLRLSAAPKALRVIVGDRPNPLFAAPEREG